MIRVCDAIMGSGKTESAITYINEHPEKKFIYITPYLDEAHRIAEGCPHAKFVEPSNRIPEEEFKKLHHIASLIKEGKNIASTHAAFKAYTPRMLQDVKDKGYTLIIDEAMDVLSDIDYAASDVDMLVQGGYLKSGNGRYYIDSECRKYDGLLFKDFIDIIKTKEVLSLSGVQDVSNTLFFWTLPTSFIRAFEEVIIMTYMVEGQEIDCYLKVNNMPYEKIGVKRDPDGTYRFGKYQEYVPEYVTSLKDKIHILQHGKLNGIGRQYTALSMNWFKTNKDDTDQLKKDLFNLFYKIWKGVPREDRLWGTFKDYSRALRGKGYTKAFLSFNARATNNYRNCTALAYLANVYVNVGHKLLYKRRGVEIDEDKYALSTMIQWIWRSAIRDGKDIYIWIPSSRMRNLLINWIDELSKGGDAACAKSTQTVSAASEESFVKTDAEIQNAPITVPLTVQMMECAIRPTVVLST